MGGKQVRCLSGAVALTLASQNGSWWESDYMTLYAFYKPRVLRWVVEFQVLKESCSVTAGWVSKGWTNTSTLQTW